MKINVMDWSEKGNKIGKLDKVDTIESQTLIIKVHNKDFTVPQQELQSPCYGAVMVTSDFEKMSSCVLKELLPSVWDRLLSPAH